MLVRQFLRGRGFSSSDLPSVAVRLSQADLAAQPAPPSAINLINQQPVKMVTGRKVYCDGLDTSSLGHPRVYINLVTHSDCLL